MSHYCGEIMVLERWLIFIERYILKLEIFCINDRIGCNDCRLPFEFLNNVPPCLNGLILNENYLPLLICACSICCL